MKIQYVCSTNKQLSKTVENYFTEMHSENEFLSAGTKSKICRKEGTTILEM
ncbi:hypothetical protein KO493_09685 [Tamlana agarivorans]|uniref:Uncharacterized protein n=1 Tax=Pseudotamlana agarivorans TaxID=481183 RepID=A0ACC5U9M3_9FLAO|nr:hypothetical protein [Tamlana agarivorans]MBU2950970.1 hypothetical protein [Tamlana agarivorans]